MSANKIRCVTNGNEEKCCFEWVFSNTGTVTQITSPEFRGLDCVWYLEYNPPKNLYLYLKDCGTLGTITPKVACAIKDTYHNVTLPEVTEKLKNGSYLTINLNKPEVTQIIEKQSFKIDCIISTIQLTTAIVTPKSEKLPVEGSLTYDLKLLKENGLFADVVIKAVGGEEFKVHSVVLAARSSVFSAMFTHSFKEAKERLIRSDLKRDVVKQMIHFLYTDNVENEDSVSSELLMAADKYNLIKLKLICGAALAKKITVENCIDFLLLADDCKCEYLTDYLIDFIAKTMNDKAFECLRNRPHLLQRFISVFKYMEKNSRKK